MKINILQGAFLPVPPIRGGAIEAAWHKLGQEFVSQGHEVCHISRLETGLKKTEICEGVKYLRVKGANGTKNPYLLKLLELPYVLRARKVAPPADIVVTHAFWAPILFPAKSLGKQYVHVGRYPKGQLRFYCKASRLQVPSHSIARACKAQAPQKTSKVRVLPYPLTWDLDEKPNLEDKRKVVLYAGRLHPEKGVCELLKAWAKLPSACAKDWILRVIGPWKEEDGGGGRAYLEKLHEIKSKSAKPVELVEPIFNRSELKEEMKKASFFLYPSMAQRGETFGLSALEAMSCACVPVVSALDCFTDFISSGVEGFYLDGAVNDNIQYSIESKLNEILSLPNSTVGKMATSSWGRAKEYGLKKVAEKYLEDFNCLL